MKIERTKNEVIIRIPASVSLDDMQDIADWMEYKELTKKSTANQEDVDNLVNTIKKGTWNKTKEKLGL